jgi:hypothetical protein
MAYSDFTVTDLKTKFGVKFTSKRLFSNTTPIEPTSWLTETLRIGRNQGYSSEKARSERLISPVLSEIQNRNEFAFAILSGMDMNVDKEKGLNGECDFIFSHSKIQDFVTAPIFCITEAKKQDIEQGTIQCAAQLIGAKILNQIEEEKSDVLFGCSTSGEIWRFLKLENNTIILDETKYLLSDLPRILGVLQEIVNLTKLG